ncbi:MAG TPA: TIGR04053 family radical SAM/SPASM domain-containing protein [Longimicrobiales bacterium]|nr:TIGR04053 family radical SAM/SPASM domain-containing protein [Longimicrobiales bacterium]
MMRHHGRPGAQHPGMGKIDFDQAPFLVIWETTQACDLACKHCRAEAQPERHPEELSTDEARQLMRDVRRFGPIIFVFSGGDCMKRPDIVELVAYGHALGLRMAITPATTPLTTRERLQELKDAGLSRLAISLDGSHPGIHDEFRRVSGSFEHGLRILRTSQEIGLSTQVNTVVARHNLDDFDNLCQLMTEVGIVFWEVFFLIPMGRARPEDVASADEFERVFHRLYDLSGTAPFDIKATAAPQYSRVVLQRKVAERRNGARDESSDVLTDGAGLSLIDGIGRARGVNDGDGFLFVSHTGEIFPSGFLPVTAGNIRSADLVDVYRNSTLFRTLRDRSQLKGKCQVCEYRPVCGGSRARAYATTGDYLEAEPFCAHVPVKYARMIEQGTAEPVEPYFARRMKRYSSSLPVHAAASDQPAL